MANSYSEDAQKILDKYKVKTTPKSAKQQTELSFNDDAESVLSKYGVAGRQKVEIPQVPAGSVAEMLPKPTTEAEMRNYAAQMQQPAHAASAVQQPYFTLSSGKNPEAEPEKQSFWSRLFPSRQERTVQQEANAPKESNAPSLQEQRFQTAQNAILGKIAAVDAQISDITNQMSTASGKEYRQLSRQLRSLRQQRENYAKAGAYAEGLSGYTGRQFVGGALQSAQGAINYIVDMLQVSYAGELNQQQAQMQRAANLTGNENLQRTADAMEGILNEQLERPLVQAADFGTRYNEKTAEIYQNPTLAQRMTGTVAEGVGGMVPSIISNIAAPGSGLYVMMAGAAGNATDEALKEGASEQNAISYGVAVGAVEGLTEMMFDGVAGVFGKGAADDAVEEIVKKYLKNNQTAQSYVMKAIGMLGEGFEEFTSEFADEFLKRLYVPTAEKTKGGELWGNALQSFLVGAAISGVMEVSASGLRGLSPSRAAQAAAEKASAQFNEQVANAETIRSEERTAQQDTGTTQKNIETTDSIKPENATVQKDGGIVLPTAAQNGMLPKLGGMSQQQNQAEAENNAVNNGVTAKEAGNNGREQSLGREERTGGLATAEQSQSVAGYQTEAEEQREGEGNGRTPVSPDYRSGVNLGIESAVDEAEDSTKTLREHTDYDSDQKSIIEYGRKRGQTVRFYTGDLWVKDSPNGETYRVRGLIHSDGKTVWIKADHSRYSSKQIYMHEDFHAAVMSSQKVLEKGIQKLKKQYANDPAGLRALINSYVEKYHIDETQVDDRYILEEILADAHAGIEVDTKTRSGETKTVDFRKAADKAIKKRTDNNSSAKQGNTTKKAADPDFESSVRKWYKDTTEDKRVTDGGYFKTGTMSDILKGIGVKDNTIFWRKQKIGSIMQDHPEIDIDIVSKVPSVLEDPIVVMRSKTHPEDSITMLGDLKAKNGDTVMVALNLTPKSGGGLDADFTLLSSAYGRSNTNVSNLLEDSEVLYLAEKEKADTLLMPLRVQFPSGQEAYGSSIGKITYEDGKVNITGKVLWPSKKASRESTPKPVSKEAEKKYGVENVDGSVVKKSRETWEKTDTEKLQEDLVKAGYTEKESKKWISDVNSVAATIAADQERLDYEAADNHSMLKSNDDYYYTLDASTLCAKRLLYQGTFDAVSHRLGNQYLTSDDVIGLRKMMADAGYEVPCGICYVESRRRHLGKYAKQWVDSYKGEYVPTVDEVTTTDGLESLRKTHPQAYKDFMDAMSRKGSANPKVVELRAAYSEEDGLMNLTKKEIENIIRIGGMRIQSFSDFETPHLIDTMQAVLDMSRRNLTSQAYTKVPNFAWVFGNTGIKINLSLIGDVDADGNLTFDNKEGINYDEAMKLRKAYSKNVGTILVGKSDAHIRAAMKSKIIDYIIPFHRSGWGQAEYQALGLSGYSDFTALQSEVAVDYGTLSGGQFYPIDYWDYSVNGNRNARTYLEKCMESGRLPKFLHLAFGEKTAQNFIEEHPEYGLSVNDLTTSEGMSNLYRKQSNKRNVAQAYFEYAMENGKIENGYWKMLIDFKMYDNAGKGAPQEQVVPNFNMKEANRILREYEGGANTLPVAQDIVDQFVEKTNKFGAVSAIVTKNGAKASREVENFPVDYNNRAVLKEETADAYLKDYASKSSPKYAQAYIGYMRPAEFLSLTTSASGRSLVEAGSRTLNEDEFAESTRYQPIQLMIDHSTGEVLGHEGRHRMVALNDAGVTKVPVLFFDSTNKYDKAEIDAIDLTGQDFGNSRSYATRTVRDLIPLSYENRDAVVRKYATMSSTEKLGEKYGLNRTLRFSREDDAYMKAAYSGNEQETEKLIASAAKKAGYDTPKIYHGTAGFGFTEFDLSKGEGLIFATDDPEISGTYSGDSTVRQIKDRSSVNVSSVSKMSTQQLINEAVKNGIDSYKDYHPATSEEKAEIIEANRRKLDDAVRTSINFLADNNGMFDDSKAGIFANVVSALDGIYKAETASALDKAVEQYENAIWDFKFADESAFDEYSKVVKNETVSAAYRTIREWLSLSENRPMAVKTGKWGFSYQHPLNLESEIIGKTGKGVYQLYGKSGNALEFDADGANWNSIKPPSSLNAYLSAPTTTRNIAAAAKDSGFDSVIIHNLYDVGGGTDYRKPGTIYIFFDENQVKSADPVTYDESGNIIPLSERFNSEKTDVRFSRDDSEWRENLNQMVEDFGEMKPGERPFRNITMPNKTSETRKLSQTVRTVLEAEATPEAIVDNIEQLAARGDFSYEVYGDKQAVKDAEERLKDTGWEKSLELWKKSVQGGKVNKKNTALGWALYDNAANEGKTDVAIDILNNMVEHQRDAAQALQATRILKKMAPETQLYGVARSVRNLQEEINERYGDENAPKLEIDEGLAEQFLKAKTDEERAEALKDIYRDIGRQMPTRFIDKINAWRYLAMLGNARTHVRNIFGNAGFAPVVAVKDLTATAIESAVSRVTAIDRTKALVSGKGGAEILSAAWNDYNNISEDAMGAGKYSDSVDANKYINEGKRVFGTSKLEAWNKTGGRALEAARTGNSALLEVEDQWFSQPHYAYAMAQYCKANGITSEQIRSGNGLDKARAYAIKEAQKATYRDTNAFSQVISNLGRNRAMSNNGVTKALSVFVEGILPFRKTPANILARGMEYSPLGLIKSLTYDLNQVKKGKMTAANAIDNISAGLTGTGLLALGIFLSSLGLIRGKGDDDEKKSAFEDLLGHQNYALELPGGTSVTLDWLAPEALPLFVGVNLWEQTGKIGDGVTLDTVLSSITNVSEPLLEMSCLQSLNDLFQSYGYSSSKNGLTRTIVSGATSYLMQFVPTILGQIERTAQQNRMTTYTSKTGFLNNTDVQYLIGGVSAKIPGFDYRQIEYIDAWGRTESSGGFVKRALNNFINPAYTSEITVSDMENELMRLYDATGENVFPSRADKTIKVDGADIILSKEQYVDYAKQKGTMSYAIATSLTESKAYSSMTDAQKASAVGLVYQYANQTAKKNVAGYSPESWVTKAKDAYEKYGIPVSTFISAKVFVSDIESLKDKKGDSISNSKGLLIMQKINENYPSLSGKARQYLLESLGVGKTVIEYSKSEVNSALREMKRK